MLTIDPNFVGHPSREIYLCGLTAPGFQIHGAFFVLHVKNGKLRGKILLFFGERFANSYFLKWPETETKIIHAVFVGCSSRATVSVKLDFYPRFTDEYLFIQSELFNTKNVRTDGSESLRHVILLLMGQKSG